MKIAWFGSLSVAVLLSGHPRVSAIDTEITPGDVQRAVTIAVSSESARDRFHAPYRIPVKDSTVQDVEIITEFRRFVMASEEQLLLGNWMLARGGFDAKGHTLRDILKHLQGQVSIRTSVSFHPLHSYPDIPPIETTIGEPSFLAVNVIRTPIWSHNSDAIGPVPLSGAIIETFFNAPSFHDRTLPLRIVFEGKQLVRVPVDFSKLE
jgi:hypothetical protein